MDHVDYPHNEGQLYDCPGCEEQCFCDGGETWTCVCCAIEQEYLAE